MSKKQFNFSKTANKENKSDFHKCTRKAAFTLAEALIVIAIIGVVAAMTIPVFNAKVSEKVNKNQKEVIENRLLEGMNQLNTLDSGFEASQYKNTEGFVRALSKYYKMSQICGAEDMKKCFPYETIKYTDEEGNEISINVEDLNTVKSFKLNPGKWLAPASFISVQGTPFLMLLKKDCTMDTWQAMKSIPTNCISYMYDIDGSAPPNKIDVDLVSHGVDFTSLKATLGGVDIMTNAFPIATGLSLSECQAEMAIADEYKAINSEVYIETCGLSNDRWAYAMKYCKDQGYHLPTRQQLADMANALYIDMNAGISDAYYYPAKDSNGNYYKIGSNEPLPNALKGVGTSYHGFWSGSESGRANHAYIRTFFATYSDTYPHSRSDNVYWGVCVAD